MQKSFAEFRYHLILSRLLSQIHSFFEFRIHSSTSRLLEGFRDRILTRRSFVFDKKIIFVVSIYFKAIILLTVLSHLL